VGRACRLSKVLLSRVVSYQQAQPIRRVVGDGAGEAARLTTSASSTTAAVRATPPSATASRHSPSSGRSATGPAKRTRYNIALILRSQSRLVAAVREPEQFVALDRAVQHRDLESDAAVLHQGQDELSQQGGRRRTMGGSP
jgi:hypothetical protein